MTAKRTLTIGPKFPTSVAPRGPKRLNWRWSYESRTPRAAHYIRFHVANAFSLLVSSIQPPGNVDKVKVLSPLDDLL
jgi:hypothetical protein